MKCDLSGGKPMCMADQFWLADGTFEIFSIWISDSEPQKVKSSEGSAIVTPIH